MEKVLCLDACTDMRDKHAGTNDSSEEYDGFKKENKQTKCCANLWIATPGLEQNRRRDESLI